MASCWWLLSQSEVSSSNSRSFSPLSVSMWLIRRAVAGRFAFFFFKLQFKEKPKNEAWGPLRRSVRGTKGN